MDVSILMGKTVANIENRDNEQLIFTLATGEQFKFYHDSDCCESVTINDIVGDLDDLIGSPLTMAEVVSSSNENPPEVTPPQYQDSFTWTFYKFATVKGYVTIRWYGESNGFYSEEVSFVAKNMETGEWGYRWD